MKILHTADWHLRDSQYGDYSRGEDFFKSASRLIAKAGELFAAGKIDCIVNGGDILDKKRPPSVVIHQLLELHDKLVELGIPMFTITGNHDQDDPSWISLTKKHKDRGIIAIDDTVVEFRGIKIRGLLETSRTKLEAELGILAEPFDVLVWHGAVKESVNFDDGSNVSVYDFMQFTSHLNTSLFLFGDIHKKQYFELNRESGKKILLGYPGSIEMANVSEPPNKSFTIIDTDTLEMEDVSLLTRPFISVNLVDQANLKDAIEFIISQNQPITINLKYYLDERLHLFDELNTVLKSRENTFKDIIRYTNESPKTEDLPVNIVGDITLENIALSRFRGTPVEDMVLALINKNANYEKVIETFVQTNIPGLA